MDEPNLRKRMDKVVELFVDDIGVIRTGRASPALIEGIVVSVYDGGQPMKLAELGTISVEGARSKRPKTHHSVFSVFRMFRGFKSANENWPSN